MNDEKTKALEKLIASCGVIIHIGEQGDHPKGCRCDECVDARTCTLGIEAIREMQAELETRKDGYLDVYVQVSAANEQLREDLRIVKSSLGFEECNRLREGRGELLAQRDNALDDVERLKEELRITKNSWNFEEGKRIIGERDLLLKMNSRLCDKQDDLRNKLRTAEELQGRIIAERDGAMDAAEREGKEGRTARHKLRAAEEAKDEAEGKMEELEEERKVWYGWAARQSYHGRTFQEWYEEAVRLQAECDAQETEMDNARLFRGRTGEVWFEEVQRLLLVIARSRSALNQADRDA